MARTVKTPAKLEPSLPTNASMYEGRFFTAEDIMKELHISKSFAYKKIRMINEELEKKGFMTFSGRVLKKAWVERTGG